MLGLYKASFPLGAAPPPSRIRREGIDVASSETIPLRPVIRTLSHALGSQLLLWLLAIALPMQATACAMAVAHGPAHVHRQAAGAVALEDFRRAPPGPSVERLVAAPAWGHVHASGLPERHRHGRFDASVVKTGAAHDAADVDEGTAPAASAGAFLALPPAPHDAGYAGPRAATPAPRRDTRFSTRHPAPPDKPPRAA